MANIPAVDKAQAERIESLLETANVPPGNPDLNSVLARLNQLEADTSRRKVPWTPVIAQESSIDVSGCFYAVDGNTVHVRIWNMRRSAGITGTATAFVIPEPYRPSMEITPPILTETGGAPGHSIWFSPGGQLRGSFVSTTGGYRSQFSYYID
ncbi:hypothetical protein [Glutamicibacter protophormiae]|uniref:hypothetical protein n=1 Tax=Glutamicibacter protophormiae TaxID=37930 RepID=UPI00195F0D53|nr:hypothetical protein [Glutamicibacter protophormiae]QRQ79802.1 hypothetical protein JQN66_06215 [Glutamicibacter protophormiae]